MRSAEIVRGEHYAVATPGRRNRSLWADRVIVREVGVSKRPGRSPANQVRVVYCDRDTGEVRKVHRRWSSDRPVVDSRIVPAGHVWMLWADFEREQRSAAARRGAQTRRRNEAKQHRREIAPAIVAVFEQRGLRVPSELVPYDWQQDDPEWAPDEHVRLDLDVLAALLGLAPVRDDDRPDDDETEGETDDDDD